MQLCNFRVSSMTRQVMSLPSDQIKKGILNTDSSGLSSTVLGSEVYDCYQHACCKGTIC